MKLLQRWRDLSRWECQFATAIVFVGLATAIIIFLPPLTVDRIASAPDVRSVSKDQYPSPLVVPPVSSERLATTDNPLKLRLSEELPGHEVIDREITDVGLTKQVSYLSGAAGDSKVQFAQASNVDTRVAQEAAPPEILRPGVIIQPSGQPPIALPSTISVDGSQSSQSAQQPPAGGASPFDPTQFRMPTLGLPEGMKIPVASAEVKKQYGQFVEREISPEETIKVVLGRAKVIDLREKPRRIYIPDENVAGFQVITDTQFALVGKKVGTTVLNLWFADPNSPNDPKKDRTLSYLIIIAPDLERSAFELQQQREVLEARVKSYQQAIKKVQSELKDAFPDSDVHLSLLGEQLLVRGEVKDVIEASQILRVVAAHAPTGRRALTGNRNLNIQYVPGLANDAAAVESIRSLLAENPNIVNLLRVPGEQQVMLMVTVAEVNRNAARSIGINFNIQKGAAIVGQFTGGLLSAATGNSSTIANLPISLDNGQVLIAIQALRTLGMAKSLAEPNLTTINGHAANFRAGGSFPVPSSTVSPGGSTQTVVYVPFGVTLHFTPTITDRTRIRLDLGAEVSTRSTDTTQVAGSSVPSNLDERTFNTTVELREGQTLAIAGLIQTTFGNTSSRVPFFGDLPIIGRAAAYDQNSSSEQELVVLVTPVLVHPVEKCQDLALPGNDVFEPGDVEFYLLGHLEGWRSQDYRASVRTDFARQKAWCNCQDEFIIGPKGASYACCNSCQCVATPAPSNSSVPQAGPTPAVPMAPAGNYPMQPAPSPEIIPGPATGSK